MYYYAFFLTQVLLVSYILSQKKELDTFIKDIESVLFERRDFLEQKFYSKCDNTICQKTYLSCVEPTPPFVCSEKYIKTECEKCYEIKGSKVGLNESVVSFIDQLSEPSAAVKEMSCLLTEMDTFFIKDMETHPFGWQYVGTYTSLFRTFPGHYVCNYDPRYRPWYIAGSTGAKNLGIIYNSVSSMKENRKDLIQLNLMENMINSLTLNDFFGIVTHSDKYKKINDTLIRATSKQKSQIKNILQEVPINAQGNLNEAFENLYSIFGNSKGGDEMGELPNQNIILLILDTVPKRQNSSTKDIVNLINNLEQQYSLNATIITYVIGTDESIVHSVKEISCSRNGFTDLIKSSDEINEKLLNYFFILSSGLVRNEVVWTEPYVDASGLGNMTSAVLPFYEKKNSHPAKLLGVIGVDVLLETILEYTSLEELNKRILEGKNAPVSSLLDFCQLQSLRGDYKCKTDKYCNVTLTEMPSCEQTFEPFHERTKILYLGKVGNCCGETKCKLLSAIYLGYIMIGLIIIIVGLIIFFVVLSKPTKFKRDEKAELKEEEKD